MNGTLPSFNATTYAPHSNIRTPHQVAEELQLPYKLSVVDLERRKGKLMGVS
jgi:hypothetical protein